MRTPIFLINFKNYKESFGDAGVKLAQICDYISKEYNVNIVIAPQHTDLKEIKSKVSIPVFAQHVDPLENPGAYTGHVIAENLKLLGVSGSLVNHSEKKLELEEVSKCVDILKNLGMVSVCCAASIQAAEKIAKLQPNFIAIEPPELIGSGISVTTKPEIIKNCIDVVKKADPNIKVLCGAGITSGEDVRKALELGTQGILVASGVVKTADPKKVLEEFVRSIARNCFE